MKYYFKIIDRLADVGGGIGAVIITVMAGIIVYEVIARTLFNNPTKWSTEYSMYTLVAATFLAAAWVMKHNQHIRVDVITSRLSDRTRTALELLTYTWSIAFCMLFVYLSGKMVYISWSLSRTMATSLLGTPMWIPHSILFFGFTLLTLQLIKQMVSKGILMTQIKHDAELTETFFAPVDRPYKILSIFIGLLILGMTLFCLGDSLRIIGLAIMLVTVLASGTPVCLALPLVGSIGLFLLTSGSLTVQMQIPVAMYASVESFILCAIPLFVFAGMLFFTSGMTGRLFDLCNAWLGFLPGNLAMATVASCAIFAALTGSSVATTATIGMIAIPAMIKRGYDKSLAVGVIVVSGTLGSTIPPSNFYILYGGITNTSVGQMFMGGVGPGLLLTVTFMMYIYFRCRKDPRYVSRGKVTWRERLVITKGASPVLLAPVIILGGIYMGIFTPTEAAGIAVLYAFLLCFVARKTTLSLSMPVITEAASKTSMILMIVAGSMVLGSVFALLQVTQQITQFAISGAVPHWGVIAMIVFLGLVLGCFIDGVAILLVVVPVCFSAVVAMGYNAVWFGVMFCQVMEIGMVTPPVGLNLYVVQGVSGLSLETVYKGAIPFLGIMVLDLIVILLFEPIITWLPSTMMG